MTHPRINAALEKLPQQAHDMAARLEETVGKAAASRYLKQQIILHDPSIKFAKSPATEPAPVLSKVVIKGERVEVEIGGVSIPAIQTEDHETWVPRAWLCKAIGWNETRLTKMSRSGKAARALAESNYSFEYVLGNCKGCRRQRMGCISLRDARIAVSVLNGGQANAA